MGGSSYSDDHYRARMTERATKGEETFKHDSDARAGKVTALHPKLNVKGVALRESRDSEAHPNSRAVIVLEDVTGSMRGYPKIMQRNLPKLMGLLLRKAYLPDPQILVSAFGDATFDRVPLQIGQFESGIEIDDDITNIYMEGGGGAGDFETPELAMYYFARHTSMDCFEKRGEKGFLFIISDEMFYPSVRKSHIEEHIGLTVQEDIPTETIFAELKEKFEVFYVMPKTAARFGMESILKPWREHLDQNVLLLDDPEGICELIASTIAITEGKDLGSVASDMKDVGTSEVVANSVEKALATYSKTPRGKSTAISVGDSGAPSGLATV